jgi:hypothetical protein
MLDHARGEGPAASPRGVEPPPPDQQVHPEFLFNVLAVFGPQASPSSQSSSPIPDEPYQAFVDLKSLQTIGHAAPSSDAGVASLRGQFSWGQGRKCRTGLKRRRQVYAKEAGISRGFCRERDRSRKLETGLGFGREEETEARVTTRAAKGPRGGVAFTWLAG